MQSHIVRTEKIGTHVEGLWERGPNRVACKNSVHNACERDASTKKIREPDETSYGLLILQLQVS